jgi:hypothetical protein
MRKNQAPKDNYKKQLRILAVTLAALLIVGGIVFGLVSLGNRPKPVDRTDTAVSQLASDMERAFPVIRVLGIDEGRDGDQVVILIYDEWPSDPWDEVEHAQMDEVFFLAMEFAVEQGQGLALNVINPTSAVDLDGQETFALLVSGTFICLGSALAEVDWSAPDHQVIVENCTLYQNPILLTNAEIVTWPPGPLTP